MKFRWSDYLSPLEILRIHQIMKKAPWWNPDKLDYWKRRRRKWIALHAYKNVPYYRKTFDKYGINPNNSDRDEVWERIPTIHKETIREKAEELTAQGNFAQGAVWAATSGSSGLPLK